MRIFPPRIEISDDEGFQPEKDIFKRANFGIGLANVIGAVEDPMVVAIDGQWGSGKTTFVKMWAGLLRQRGHPVIYFDAFANDYIDDAFLAISGEVVALSQQKQKESTPGHKKFLAKAARAGRALLRSGTKIGVKAATLGALDAADLAELKSVADDIADEVSLKSDEYIETLILRHREERQSIESFRTALSELANELGASHEGQGSLPLIFIVDELDRCKPPFALDLLEKIKHVFSVSGVHFVLVTHLAQLENVVRFSYGNEIDAITYLQKFYNLIVHLPGDSKHDHERISRKFIAYLRPYFVFDDSALEFIELASRARSLSLRSIEKILVYLSLAIAFTNSKKSSYFRPPPILAGLCVLKVVAPQLFEKAKSGLLTYEEAFEAFGFSKWPEKSTARQWALQWWQYALHKDIDFRDPTWQAFVNDARARSHVDREDIVRVVADGVIDRMQVPKE
jgi:energy-coupling factor transporter ATP-binding protein EcfA2